MADKVVVMLVYLYKNLKERLTDNEFCIYEIIKSDVSTKNVSHSLLVSFRIVYLRSKLYNGETPDYRHRQNNLLKRCWKHVLFYTI